MHAAELIAKLTRLKDIYGDLELAIETTTLVLELKDGVDWDTFEPGHPGYFILEADDASI